MSLESRHHRYAANLHSEGWTEKFKRGTVNVATGAAILGITGIVANAAFHTLCAPFPSFEH